MSTIIERKIILKVLALKLMSQLQVNKVSKIIMITAYKLLISFLSKISKL